MPGVALRARKSRNGISSGPRWPCWEVASEHWVEATGRSTFFALRETLARQGRTLEGLKVAIQGFGNVGSFFARFVADAGATVVAVSDSTGGRHDPAGLDVAALVAHKAGGGQFLDFAAGEALTNEDFPIRHVLFP